MKKPAFGSQREALTINKTLFNSSDTCCVTEIQSLD